MEESFIATTAIVAQGSGSRDDQGVVLATSLGKHINGCAANVCDACQTKIILFVCWEAGDNQRYNLIRSTSSRVSRSRVRS